MSSSRLNSYIKRVKMEGKRIFTPGRLRSVTSQKRPRARKSLRTRPLIPYLNDLANQKAMVGLIAS